MPLTDDFDGTYGSGLSLTVTTPGGSPVEIPIHGIENLEFPDRNHKIDKYTPISGVRAGKEQLVIVSEESGEITCSLTYEKTHQVAMDAIAGVNGSAVELVLSDGLTVTGTGGIQRIGVARIEDSRHMTVDITIPVAAGWLMVDAGDDVVVSEYTVTMIAGAITIDLTACGAGGTIDLTGNYITRIRLESIAGNANPVTIEEGATNGYDPSGDDFVVILSPGTTSDSSYTSGTAVSPTVKTLDVSGTAVESILVYIESSPV